MTASPDLHTLWRGAEIIVTRGDEEIDRIAADALQRVILAYGRQGDTPGDLEFALLELPDDWVLLGAHTGIGGRIHFERQAWWAERRCIYWVPRAAAPLPRVWQPGHWWRRHHGSGHARLPHEQLAAQVERWPLEGPQTWEERKWQRIVRSRPLAPVEAGPAQRR